MIDTYINWFYGFIAFALLAGSFLVKPRANGWLFYMIVIVGFSIGGVIFGLYLLASSAFVAGVVSIYRLRQHIGKNRSLEVIFISDHDDQYLRHFLDYYRVDISKCFPGFDFRIEEEFLVALLVSEMKTVGIIIAEIKNADTLRICLDYIVPVHRRSNLAKTFYQCELRCIDFLGYRNFYIEPQSKAHNNYLEKLGYVLVDGKYVNKFSGK